MNKNDVIKVKEIHVQLLFYLEIINGFDTLLKGQEIRSKFDLKKGPTIMNSAQSSKFKRIVLPILLKPIEDRNLLYDFYNEAVQSKKDSYILKLREQMYSANELILQLESGLEEEIELIKDLNSHLGKIKKIVKTYDRIKRTILLIRGARSFYNDNKTKLKLNYLALQDLSRRDDIKNELLKVVLGSLSYFKPLLLHVLCPTFVKLGQTIDDKVGGIINLFWWFIGKRMLFPDWSDWVDIGLWVLAWAGTIVGVVGSVFSGGTSMSITAGAWALRFAKVANVISKISSKVKNLLKVVSIAQKTSYYASKARMYYKRSKMYYGIGQSLYTGLDIIDFDHEDRTELLNLARKATRPMGEKVIKNLQERFGKILGDFDYITEGFREMGADAMKGIQVLNYDGGWKTVYLLKHGATIELVGLNSTKNIEFFTKVSNVADSLNDLLSFAANHAVENYSNPSFASFGIDVVINGDLYNYKNLLIIKGNSMSWTPKVGTLANRKITFNIQYDSSKNVYRYWRLIDGMREDLALSHNYVRKHITSKKFKSYLINEDAHKKEIKDTKEAILFLRNVEDLNNYNSTYTDLFKSVNARVIYTGGMPSGFEVKFNYNPVWSPLNHSLVNDFINRGDRKFITGHLFFYNIVLCDFNPFSQFFNAGRIEATNPYDKGPAENKFLDVMSSTGGIGNGNIGLSVNGVQMSKSFRLNKWEAEGMGGVHAIQKGDMRKVTKRKKAPPGTRGLYHNAESYLVWEGTPSTVYSIGYGKRISMASIIHDFSYAFSNPEIKRADGTIETINLYDLVPNVMGSTAATLEAEKKTTELINKLSKDLPKIFFNI